MALDSRSPMVPASGPSPASPRLALGLESGAEDPFSRDMGHGWKGGRPPARHEQHVHGNLMLNHSQMTCFWVGVSYIEHLPHCDLLKVSPRHIRCPSVPPSLFSLHELCLSVGGQWCVLGPGPSLGRSLGSRGAAVLRGAGGSRGRGGVLLAAPPGLGVCALLCSPAAGPSPRAGTGDKGEMWCRQESTDIAG